LACAALGFAAHGRLGASAGRERDAFAVALAVVGVLVGSALFVVPHLSPTLAGYALMAAASALSGFCAGEALRPSVLGWGRLVAMGLLCLAGSLIFLALAASSGGVG
jgi:hypothetical protein